MILDDRRMKVRKLVHAVGISTERVHHILHEYLDMRKLSARWVPRLLTLDHKRNRVTTSKECLAMFSRNPDEFLRRFVTVDETWIHHNTPDTKEQSKQWVSRGECGPKKAKQSLSAKKVMATVFEDARGIIHIDYLEKVRDWRALRSGEAVDFGVIALGEHLRTLSKTLSPRSCHQDPSCVRYDVHMRLPVLCFEELRSSCVQMNQHTGVRSARSDPAARITSNPHLLSCGSPTRRSSEDGIGYGWPKAAHRENYEGKANDDCVIYSRPGRRRDIAATSVRHRRDVVRYRRDTMSL
ncbi:Histone-lysine N-methyltransferase SETMAR [Eumeta japonica]|uniref:Histone-lysine N-methyltransferase SETMAR n=1 Tax=Eumeta variegata TaxID=151549 RepID=A0A4C1YWX1_EUMVA|nr:Histone-lysine N-methyltransferase SETMAR [Eumeta japonica]